MGEQQAVDALVVASAFNGITRVADATGIPLDENTADTTVEMRDAVGLDAFDYAAKISALRLSSALPAGRRCAGPRLSAPSPRDRDRNWD